MRLGAKWFKEKGDKTKVNVRKAVYITLKKQGERTRPYHVWSYVDDHLSEANRVTSQLPNMVPRGRVVPKRPKFPKEGVEFCPWKRICGSVYIVQVSTLNKNGWNQRTYSIQAVMT